MDKTIKEWLLEHEEEFVQDLFTLVRINSVRGETKEDLPFGEGPKEALDAGLKICEEFIFFFFSLILNMYYIKCFKKSTN